MDRSINFDTTLTLAPGHLLDAGALERAMKDSRKSASPPGSRAAGGLLAILLLLCGCSSSSNYVAPRVVGRVFDAETHQPLAGVEVRRLAEEQKPGPGEQRKGGQAMMAPQPIRSSADGSFVLESHRALALFRQIHWFSV